MTKDELEQTKEGYWRTDEYFEFKLKQPVEDMQDFGKQLKKYIKLKGIPFKTKDCYLMFVDQRADKDCNPYWNKGYLIMHVKKKSLKSYLNPRHNELTGDETIVIEWEKGDSEFISYQELKFEYFGRRITWKLPLEQIKEFKRMLERFANADDIYKLLLECAAEDE